MRKDGRAIVEKAQSKEKILADKIVYEEELIQFSPEPLEEDDEIAPVSPPTYEECFALCHPKASGHHSVTGGYGSLWY